MVIPHAHTNTYTTFDSHHLVLLGDGDTAYTARGTAVPSYLARPLPSALRECHRRTVVALSTSFSIMFNEKNKLLH